MRNRVTFITVIFLLVYSGLPAQNSVQTTGLVEYEVLTSELQYTVEPQSIQLKIDIVGTAMVNNIDINLGGTQGKLTLLSAEKSGTALWLIPSQQNAARDNVLAWNYSDSAGILSIYPSPYPEPYTLILEIQVNLNRNNVLAENQQYSVLVEANLPNGMFAATATGRGNLITLNK
jgi:hypothetical protein